MDAKTPSSGGLDSIWTPQTDRFLPAIEQSSPVAGFGHGSATNPIESLFNGLDKAMAREHRRIRHNALRRALALNHFLRIVRSNVLEISTSRLAKLSARAGSSSLKGKPIMIACFRVRFRIFVRLPDVQFPINVANAARVKGVGTK